RSSFVATGARLAPIPAMRSRSPVRRVPLALALCAAGMLMTACTSAGVGTSPTAPSVTSPAGPASLTLTVRVHARTTESPIAGALVLHDASRFYTDRSGELAFTIDAGKEITVEVSAAGYHPMTAAAIVNSAESWTFFLQ